MSAPRSSAFVHLSSAGDASGGSHILRIYFEAIHAHMLAWTSIAVEGAAAAVDAYCELRFCVQGGGSCLEAENVTCTPREAGVVAAGLWRPPPIFSDVAPNSLPYARVIVPNVDTQEVNIYFMAHQFSPGASQSTPLPFLVGNFAS